MMKTYAMLLVYNCVYILVLVVFVLIALAFFTLGERKLMAAIQRRKGPDVVGFWGILQPIADGVKLLFKELIIPSRASVALFLFGPCFVFFLSILGWAVVPYGTSLGITTFSFPMLLNFLLSGLSGYGLLLSGWASNSRYAFLGGIRAAAQMVSYELTFGVINLIVVLFSGSMNYVDIVNVQVTQGWFIWGLFPVFMLYLVVMLAETNRTPFDLAEAEAELVAGYNVEYSSMSFAFFFLGEYANMLLLSLLGCFYFLGGWGFWGYESYVFLFLKVVAFSVIFVWVRATLPRFRYDQLMFFGWKYLLPIALGLFVFYASVLYVIVYK